MRFPRKRRFSGKKRDFSGDFRRFSEAKSHDVEKSGAKNFPLALIPLGLNIICNFSGKIYTPGG
jgi:hypothetical protein